MQTLSQKFDNYLAELSWSLWTELGVAGVIRRHQKFLIPPEEALLLTAAIAEIDPRLRDETLDWCSRYHHFISISRLRTLAKAFDSSVSASFSTFAATLNSVSRAHWPLLVPSSAHTFTPSGKSRLPKLESPALLYFKLRTLFGVGARADLLAFFLTEQKGDFAIADVTETGYSKRNLADILEGFAQAGIFDKFIVRNQQRYSLSKRDQLLHVVGPLPEFAPPWRHILEVLLIIRACIHCIEKKSESTKVVEIRNTLVKIEDKLHRLNLVPPSMQSDFRAYLHSFSKWALEMVELLAQGRFQISPKQIFEESDFIGCFQAKKNLSSTYKQETIKSIKVKHGIK